MTTPLRTAQSRLANAARYGSPDDIAAARAAFHTEKLRAAIEEHYQYLPKHTQELLDRVTSAMLYNFDEDLL